LNWNFFAEWDSPRSSLRLVAWKNCVAIAKPWFRACPQQVACPFGNVRSQQNWETLALNKFISNRILIVVCLGLRLSAQQVPNPVSGYTPAALAPGVPDGSYILSDFDSVNYGNMTVGFRFPLVKIGGRGSASTVFAPSVSRMWSAFPAPSYSGGTSTSPPVILGYTYAIQDQPTDFGGTVP
jgi:hypothetical protein